MVKSTALPSGSTCGRRWLSSPFAGSGVVNTSGVPPASATCHRPPPPWFAKMIRPFGPQLIPAGSAVRQKVTTGPPASGTFFSSPTVGPAFRASLPETDPLPIGREERAFRPLRSLDRRRIQSIHPPHIQLPRLVLATEMLAAGGRDASFGRRAVRRRTRATGRPVTTRWPIEMDVRWASPARARSGSLATRQRARARLARGGSCRARLQAASAERAAATTMANAAASTHRQFTVRVIAAGVATSVGAARASSIAMRRLAASCQRRRGSLCRQCRSSVRIPGGSG